MRLVKCIHVLTVYLLKTAILCYINFAIYLSTCKLFNGCQSPHLTVTLYLYHYQYCTAIHPKFIASINSCKNLILVLFYLNKCSIRNFKTVHYVWTGHRITLTFYHWIILKRRKIPLLNPTHNYIIKIVLADQCEECKRSLMLVWRIGFIFSFFCINMSWVLPI